MGDGGAAVFSGRAPGAFIARCAHRLESLSGSNPWIRVSVNGNIISQGDLLNKPNKFMVGNGITLAWFDGRDNRWRVIYAPDFKSAIEDQSGSYSIAPEDEPYRFVWDITRYVQPGKNALRIDLAYYATAHNNTLVLRNVKLEMGKGIESKAKADVTPAPTGPVPIFVATGLRPTPMSVSLAPKGVINLAVGERTFRIGTRTSLPGGKWQEAQATRETRPVAHGKSADVEWQAGNCGIRRRVIVRDDHVHVADTFTNVSNELVGVIVEHVVTLTSVPQKVFLAGMPMRATTATMAEPANPSSFGEWKAFGLGLVAEDDVFRVHVSSFIRPEGFGISDNRLGIPAGSSITLEWNIYPVLNGGYWDFVNAVRRNWDTNFTIPGPFAFHLDPKAGKPAEWHVDWARKRALKMISSGIARYHDGNAYGKFAYGTAINCVPDWVAEHKDWVADLRIGAPEIMVLGYFHSQVSTEPGGAEKYADSRLLDVSGDHALYPHRNRDMLLYVPTLKNSYGTALRTVLNVLLDEIQVSGIYWDQMAWSVYPYVHHAPWDGCSVALDSKSHAVLGKVSSAALLMQPLKLDVIRHLADRGVFLMGNHQPQTRTMTRQKIVRFVEAMGSYSKTSKTHLGCPLVLGNFHKETTQGGEAEEVREILNYGGVYYGHTYRREPAPWNFTSVMYPITPVEIHAGVILGEERIHTAISGRFGWPDGAAADVYVVDAQGRQAEQLMVKETRHNGKHLYEIRMPSDHFAILVKK